MNKGLSEPFTEDEEMDLQTRLQAEWDEKVNEKHEISPTLQTTVYVLIILIFFMVAIMCALETLRHCEKKSARIERKKAQLKT